MTHVTCEKQAIRDCLKTMGLPMRDLMLMHAPGPAEIRAETWRALEEAHHEVHLTIPGLEPNVAKVWLVTLPIAAC